jgi:phage shock protein A
MRLCKADIHGVMDQLEDKGLVLKQYLRDMEKELDQKEARLKKMVLSRDQAERDHEKHARECAKIEQDVTVAIEKDKDDIARTLIKKLKSIGHHQDELERHMESLDKEITKFENCLHEQRLQHEHLQLRSAEYFRGAERQAWEKVMANASPPGAGREPSEEEIEIELLQRKEALRGGEEK